MKIVFMGSPDFAVPSLEALIEARFDVQLVVTQPDRPAGRGRKMLPTAVKAAAQEHNLPVIDYDKCIACGSCVEKCPTGAMTG